jgi:hypothetical protein
MCLKNVLFSSRAPVQRSFRLNYVKRSVISGVCKYCAAQNRGAKAKSAWSREGELAKGLKREYTK